MPLLENDKLQAGNDPPICVMFYSIGQLQIQS